jgi:hypothetical protein
MEVRLTKNAKDRQRAIAMVHYLDPKSPLVAQLKKGEIEAATKVWANPFRQPSKREGAPA